MTVSGDLALTALADIVQFYASRGDAVAIRLELPGASEAVGTLYIQEGELVHATLAGLIGPAAARAALRIRQGRFTVERNVRSEVRTIDEPLTRTLLDAHAEDEAEGGQPDFSSLAAPRQEDQVTTPISHPPPDEELAPTEPPPPLPRSGRTKVLMVAGGVALLGVIGVVLAVSLQARQAAQAAKASADAKAAAAAATPAELPPFTFGMVAPLSGPAKELGRQMRTGVEIAFSAANEAGGIEGRKLKLLALDDGYEPGRTLAAMKELVEKHHVLGFIGNVGTPTAAVALPYALEQKRLFFGAFTGAPLLRREPPDRYVFNYRASYAEETAATVRYLIELRRVKPEQIAVFAQKDGYGDAGFDGVARVLRQGYQRDPQKILRLGYERNTVDVQAAADELAGQRGNIRAVIMVATYRAAAKFIEKLRERGGDQILTNVSFVGSTALSEELTQLGPKFVEGVVVTQVVPLPEAGATALMRYREQLNTHALGERPDFVSLEGYIAASILAEAIRHAGREAGTEQIVDALEGLRGLDLGFGVTFSFGLSQHQASHKVWGTMLDEKGQFKAIELD
jgi:branched-chain amino acid transport system substrate-binding protein